ncbi:hypothetical protein PMIN06_008142 [Paraphaeosphaeria minitans]
MQSRVASSTVSIHSRRHCIMSYQIPVARFLSLGNLVAGKTRPPSIPVLAGLSLISRTASPSQTARKPPKQNMPKPHSHPGDTLVEPPLGKIVEKGAGTNLWSIHLQP